MILPRKAEQILALHDQGLTLRAIAVQVGCSPGTVSGYTSRRRTPGRPAPRQDPFGAFLDYCRQRLTDDPRLRTAVLFEELTGLGYPGSRPTFYRALDRHDLLPGPPARNGSGTRPTTASAAYSPGTSRPLPVRVPPATGETLASYLARVSAGNHIALDTLLTILPVWFHRKITSDDDLRRHHNQPPASPAALHRLSYVTGITVAALEHALPALADPQTTGPMRITSACRRCMATRGVDHPVPVYLPANVQICLRHNIWLSSADQAQFDIATCPEIASAHNRARRLLRRLTPEELLFARVTAEQHIRARPTRTRRQWIQLLHTANPNLTGTGARRELANAAAYPDIIHLAVSIATPG